MGQLRTFLEESRINLNRWKTLQEIHIVIGNESCDLDSMISSIAYGFFLSKKLNINCSTDKAVFPILNVTPSQLRLRLEHCFLLNKVGISLDNLIFRSEVIFEEIIQNFSSLNKCFKTYLVDHHITAVNEDVLKNTVCKIFDHRPVSESHCWDKKNIEMRIESVGSCATIVAHEIFTEREDIWNQELAYLVYSAIVFDTKGLKSQKKTTSLDLELASKLELKFNFFERKSLVEKLNNLHCEISHLSPFDMLTKDLKCADAVAFPRICVLASQFIRMKGGLEALYKLCSERHSLIAVIIGSDQKGHEKKDIGILFNCTNMEFIQDFIHKLKKNGLKEYPTALANYFNFNFKHEKMSRKEIVPIIMKIYNDCKHKIVF